MIPSLKIDDHGVPGKLDEFAKSIDESIYLQIGNTVVALMQERTAAGLDVDYNPFADYSTTPMYAPVTNRVPGYPTPAGGRLTKSGKSMHFPGGYREYKAGLGRGTSVQLSVSNAMESAMTVRSEDDKCVISFATSEAAEKAHGHQFGAGHLPERKHFGISERSLPEVETKLAELIIERAARAGLPVSS